VSHWFQVVRAVALLLLLGTCADFVKCSLLLDDCLSLPSEQTQSHFTTKPHVDVRLVRYTHNMHLNGTSMFKTRIS
jgi:hypothetical protein